MTAPAQHDSTGEKRHGLTFAEKDEALRRDVRALGAMVGELLMEQGGEALFKSVESARRSAIARREGDLEASDKLDKLLDRLSAAAARDVVRAFSTYFQVVNTAEQVHRIRRRREYLKDTDKRQPRSFDATFFELREAGFEVEAVQELLSRLAIQPVFTPHPTETTRRTILRKQQNIVRKMVDVQNPALTPQESNACFANIRADITSIWQTEESPDAGLTVFDELEHTLFFLTDVIYRVIPPFYEAIENSLAEIYGEDAQPVRVPDMLHFGSWIGGDVSTNEEISARTIRDVLARQRSLVLDLYFRDCRLLAEKLSQSVTRVDVDEAVLEKIENYSKQFPGIQGSTPHRHRNMPYRVLLRLISQRLQSTYDEGVFPYETAEQFADDVRVIATSLQNRRGAHAGLFAVKRLIRRIDTFGFYFLSVDIRHNADDLHKAIGYCMGEDDWLKQSSEQRTAKIRRALEINDSPAVEPDNDTKRLFSTFAALAYCRRKYGNRAIGALLIRHCDGVDDVLAALLVARWSDIHSADGLIPLDIAPCFETPAELRKAPRLISALLEDPIYRRNLESRGSHQLTMLSISEATSHESVVSSRWNMQRAYSHLSTIFDEAGVDYTFFHGRGVLSGRGGVSDGIVHGHLRATEHGDSVNERYGVRGIAVRTLEKAFSAVATATADLNGKSTGGGKAGDAAELTARSTLIDAVAQFGNQATGSLAALGLEEYFALATPIDVIETMRSENGGQREADAEHARRNLPWAFAWAQARFLLPSWYGFGTGLEAAIEERGIEEVRKVSRDWPFFRRLVTDIEISMAIADLGIASQYSQLAGRELHKALFPVINTEYEKSVSNLLLLREQDVLLQNNETLRRSIRLRNPYVDPMSILQVKLLERWREGNREDKKILIALRASVNGISRGLQTST